MTIIDWTKPINIVKHGQHLFPATVLATDYGNRLIAWEGPAGVGHAFVDRDGRLIATLHNGAPCYTGEKDTQFVANVPEEPKDTLILWRNKPDGTSWSLHWFNPVTRSDAEASARHLRNACDREVILVTVGEGALTK